MIGCDCAVCTSADPRDSRFRSSVLVSSATTQFVIDTTPDFRSQMLRAGVKHLDAVLFTHPHKDHIAGLDDVKAFCWFSKQPMAVYANELTREALRREFHYVFAEKRYPGIPELDVRPIDLEPFYIGDIPVIPILVWHLHMPVLGFRLGHFTYITDANRIDPQEREKIRGSQALVLNALRREKHISHFTLDEAVDVVQQLGIPQGYFTHISHQLGLHATINAELPAGIQLAYDELVLDFPEKRD